MNVFKKKKVITSMLIGMFFVIALFFINVQINQAKQSMNTKMSGSHFQSSNVESISVTPTSTNNLASIRVKNTDVVRGISSSAINLPVGGKTIHIAATSEDTTIIHAEQPQITKQPEGKTVNIGESVILTVSANIKDKGVLSYQWYKNTNNSNSGGTPITGATNASYQVPTTEVGTSYYYVVVTNTNNNVNGTKTASVTSASATVTVKPVVSAAQPQITSQPAGTTVDKGSKLTLTVSANVTDGGTLSYQWYKNTSNSNTGGTVINGAKSASYQVPTTEVGTSYYYVVVTNTNNAVSGTKTASVTSSVAAVTVNSLKAEQPKITKQPEAKTVDKGDKLTLTVNATSPDGGVLSYQWYENTTSSTNGSTSISGATNSSYDVPTDEGGTTYYYVVVTNTNNYASETKTATVTSSIVKVTVNSNEAEQPKIEKQPEGKTVNKGENLTLSVTAKSPDGGTLSYQWYSNTSDSRRGGTSIDGATSASYKVPTTEVGTFYYYVVVTNTNNKVSGTKTASITSSVAKVTVNSSQAEQPKIEKQPEGRTVNKGSNVTLTVSAKSPDGGTLSYQWYKNTINSSNGGTVIRGAIDRSYQVPTNEIGTFYYYVVVTNTNDYVNGTKTASVTSSVASVTVNGRETDLVTIGRPTTPIVVGGGNSSLHGGDIVGHWAAQDIMKLVNSQLISGYPDGSFRPDNIITRAEFTAIIVRALGLNPWEAMEFSDTRNHWAKGVISTAYVHGIIRGYSETNFGPDDPITREQMAAIIANAFNLQHRQGTRFTDHHQISIWAIDAVERAASNGIIAGYQDGTFRPKNYATRAEAAAVIVRVLQ